ncbi:hypothetical protein GCM10022397_42300 [Flavivirga jejuensis]
MKMAGLHHVLSHTNDEDHETHCAICDHAITHNLTPALIPNLQDFIIENTEPIALREIIKNYNFVITSTIARSQLFSRPPPFLL